MLATIEHLESRTLLSGMTALSAEAFIDSVGVNAGWTRTEPFTYKPDGSVSRRNDQWLDWQTSAQRIKELGVRYGRARAPILTDDGGPTDQAQTVDRLLGTAEQSNIRWLFNLPRLQTIDGQQRQYVSGSTQAALATVEAKVPRSVITGLAGANEFDNGKADGTWEAQWVDIQREFWDATQASSLSHLPAVAGPLTFPNNVDNLPDVSGIADVGNLHTYSVGGVDTFRRAAQSVFPDKPLWSTEYGLINWTTSGQNVAATQWSAAKELPLRALQNFQEGIDRSYLFEIRDLYSQADGNGGFTAGGGDFGLLDSFGRPKPAYTALQNLLAILGRNAASEFVPDDESPDASRGAGHWAVPRLETRALDIDVRAPESKGVRHMLLQRADGRYYLAMWRDPELVPSRQPQPAGTPVKEIRNEAVNVTLDLNGKVRSAYVYRDLDELDQQGDAVAGNAEYARQTISNPTGSVTVAVGDEVTVVELWPKNGVQRAPNFYREAEQYQNPRGHRGWSDDNDAANNAWISNFGIGGQRDAAELSADLDANKNFARGYASYELRSPANATVDVWVKVRAAANDAGVANNDMLYFDWRGDGAAPRRWDGQISGTMRWQWHKIATRSVAANTDYTFDLGFGDDGLHVDRLYFSFDGAAPDSQLGEAGTLTFDQESRGEWNYQRLNTRVGDPVVVLGPPTENGTDAAVVRTRNITPRGFEYQLDEWPNGDGRHAAEQVGYVVLDRGRHDVSGLGTIEAGVARVTHQYAQVNFASSLASPGVLASVEDLPGSTADVVTPRVTGVGTGGFRTRVQEAESGNDWHEAENVHWLAFDSAATPAAGLAAGDRGLARPVDENFRTINHAAVNGPVRLALIDTTNGADPVALRLRDLTQQRFTMFAEEETSGDAELAHPEETAAWMVVAAGPLYERRTSNGPRGVSSPLRVATGTKAVGNELVKPTIIASRPVAFPKFADAPALTWPAEEADEDVLVGAADFVLL